MSVSDPRHPLWGFLKFVIMMCAVTVVLALNASKFDKTEWIAIAEIAGAWLVGKGALAIKENFKEVFAKPRQPESIEHQEESA